MVLTCDRSVGPLEAAVLADLVSGAMVNLEAQWRVDARKGNDVCLF